METLNLDDESSDEVTEQGFLDQLFEGLKTLIAMLALGIPAFFYLAPPALRDPVRTLAWSAFIPVPSDVMIEAKIDFDGCGREQPLLVKYTGLEGNGGTLIKTHNLKAYVKGNPDPIISFARATYSIDAELRAGDSIQRCWAFSSRAGPEELASLLKYDLENLDWRIDALVWVPSSMKSRPNDE